MAHAGGYVEGAGGNESMAFPFHFDSDGCVSGLFGEEQIDLWCLMDMGLGDWPSDQVADLSSAEFDGYATEHVASEQKGHRRVVPDDLSENG